jgi:thioredoxin 1
MSTLVNVTDHSFDAQVLKCDIPVLTHFWAGWSAQCKTMDAHLQEVAAEYDEQIRLIRLDIEMNPTFTSQYTVLNIPTLILFKNGQEVQRITGVVSKAELLEKIEPYLDH